MQVENDYARNVRIIENIVGALKNKMCIRDRLSSDFLDGMSWDTMNLASQRWNAATTDTGALESENSLSVVCHSSDVQNSTFSSSFASLLDSPIQSAISPIMA